MTMTGEKFTTLGIMVVGALLWIAGQTGGKDARDMINMLLALLLLSIVLMRWDVVKPYLFKQG